MMVMQVQLQLYCWYLSIRTGIAMMYDNALFSKLGSKLLASSCGIVTAKIVCEDGDGDWCKCIDDTEHVIRALFASQYTSHTCGALIDKLGLTEASKPFLYLEYMKMGDDVLHYKYIDLFAETSTSAKNCKELLTGVAEELQYGEIIL